VARAERVDRAAPSERRHPRLTGTTSGFVVGILVGMATLGLVPAGRRESGRSAPTTEPRWPPTAGVC